MSSAHRLIVIVVVAVLGALTFRTFYGAGEPLAYYAPDAFVERANRWTRDGYLRASCLGREPQIEVDWQRVPAAEKAWFEASYLKTDIDRFNADPGAFSWTFLIDRDCRLLGVNPAVHTIDLPFHQRLAWLGSIFYRGAAPASLRSPQRQIELTPARKPQPVERMRATEIGRAEDVQAEGTVLLTLGGRARQAAAIFSVGDQMVVQNSLQGPDTSLRLMGHPLPVGRLTRLDTGDWLALESREPGRRRQETFVYRDFAEHDIASVVRRQNNKNLRLSDDPDLGRITDPLRQETYPYLDQVAKSVSQALGALPKDEADRLTDGFDVQLSIDRRTQVELSRIFRERLVQLRRSRGLEPFSAGLTLMDGKSGEVLALLTAPAETELEDLELSPRQKRRLLQNQNLIVHPIGSAGKPFFFAAVADAFPELTGLEIAGYAPERYHPDLFQCRLPFGYHLLEGNSDGRIDFTRALEVSCNKYTVELLTLSLAAHWARHQEKGPEADGLERLIPRAQNVAWPKPGYGSGVWIDGEALSYAPSLEGFIKSDRPIDPRRDDPARGAVVGCSTMSLLDRAAFASRFEHLTAAATYMGRDPNLPKDPSRTDFQAGFFADAYDLSPWQKLVARLSLGHEQDPLGLRVRAALHAVAPERVNLALNQVTRLRADFISLALGGGNSLWTNVQLAESFSRLVGGRELEASLVGAILDRDPEAKAASKLGQTPARPIAALTLKKSARSAVLSGLERVVEGERGTARALKIELDKLRQRFPDNQLLIYGKTGSPILDKPAPAVAGRALEELVGRSRLIWDGKIVAQTAGAKVGWAARNSAGRAAWEQAFQKALAEVGFGRAAWVRTALLRAVDRSAEAINRPSTAEIGEDDELDAPLRLEGRNLVLDRDSGLFKTQSVKSLAAVFVFSIVKLPNDVDLPPSPEDLLDPRVKILTVALHLEAGEGSTDAVALAREILPELESLLMNEE